MSENQVGSLIETCNEKSIKLHTQALICRWLSDLGRIITIMASTTIGAIAAYYGTDIVTLILSVVIAVMNALTAFYTPERKAYFYEKISIEFSQLVRKLRPLDTKSANQEQIKKTIDEVHSRLDILRMKQFSSDTNRLYDEERGEHQQNYLVT